MKSFSEYLSEMDNQRKYIAVEYDEKSQMKLMQWCHNNNITHKFDYHGLTKKQPFIFHTTIFYTESLHNMKNTVSKMEGTVNVTGISMLGENNDIPVFDIESQDIRRLRKYFESLGFKDKWDIYRPHISITYDKNCIKDIDSVNGTNLTLTYNKLVVDDILS